MTDFSGLLGPVQKDLEAIGTELHTELSADLDQLRQNLPAITQAAHTHVDAIASTVVGMIESHLAKVRQIFGLDGTTPATPATVPTSDPTVAAVDPTVAPSTTTEATSAPSSDASSTTPTDTPASA